jgi:hypothetical protein
VQLTHNHAVFLNPLMLAWIAGAAVPLLVHLLSKSRYRSVEWGAMMFLPGVDAVHQQSARLKQWLLLAIRSAIVGLLAVALARPVFSGRYASLIPAAGLTTGGQATVVIILDDSASMGYTQNGRSRLDQAKEVTLQILSGLKRGDQAALLLAGLPADQSMSAPVTDLQSIASRVGDLTPATGSADFADAMYRAASLLDRFGGTDREIYVVCDRQALSWRRASESWFTNSWAARRAAGRLPRLTAFPVGGYEADNIAVESITIADPPLIRGQSQEIRVGVRNFGTAAATAVPVSIWSGPRAFGDATITVPADTVRQVVFSVRFPEAGSFVVSAAVKSSGLTYDDRLDRSEEVIDPIRVLLIDGDSQAIPGEPNPTASLQTALSMNNRAHRRTVEPMNVTQIPAESLASAPLGGYQVLVLCDVSSLKPDAIRDIEQFVYDGGGIFFIPGQRVQADEFNQLLYRSGSGIFPAALSPATAPESRTAITVSKVDRQHPVFQFLNGRPIPVWAIHRLFPAKPRTPDARVIAGYSSGQPFLIETNAGRGHVLMATTSFTTKWSDIAETPSFASLIQSIVHHLTATAIDERNLSPNQPIIATVSGPIDDRVPTVQRMPGGRRDAAIVRRFEDRTETRYYRTETPGTYRLRYRIGGVEKSINFVVTGSRAESDLTPLTDVRSRKLQARLNMKWIEPSPAAIAAAVDHQRGGRELWIDLLAGVLLLSMLELGLTRWWSRRR